MPVRSRRLSLRLQVPIAGVALFTVPVDRTLILRTVVFWNVSLLLTARERLYVIPVEDGLGLPVDQSNVGPDAIHRPDLRDDIILNPGDILYADASIAATIYAMAFGSLLNGPPT